MNRFWSEDKNAATFLKFMPPLKQKLYKNIADIIKERNINRILDFGCGNGNQLEFLQDDIEIGLYDLNKVVAAETFNKYKVSKKVSFIDYITNESTNNFDAIIVNMVWMCLNGEKEIDQFFNQIKKAKSDKGIVILSMTHPCFRDKLFSYYHTGYTTSKKLFDYTDEGAPFEVVIKNESHSAFTDYHHSLTYFFNKIKQHGLEMTEFKELYDEEYNLTLNKRFTPYILTILK